jgi:hypothetical protein
MDASVYSEAKGEYTKQLITFIVPAYHRFFMEVLQQASQEEPQSKRQLWKFQELLSQIPEWNIDKVQRETSRIQGLISCDYLEELLTAVFIAHTKVLTAIRIGNKNKRVQITIPKLDHFLHRALSESSRLLWSSAYLFHNELSAIEKQKNHRQIEQLLQEGIQQAIRGLLPVKNILKDYLAEPDGDTDADADDEDETADQAQDEKQKEHSEQEPVAEVPVTSAVPIQESLPIVEEKTVEAVIKEELPVLESAPIEPLPIQSAPVESTPVENQPIEPVQGLIAIKVQDTAIEEKPVQSEQPLESLPNPEPPIALAPTPMPTPALTSTPSPAPAPPTLVVETEPSVRFTDFDQVIQQRGGKMHIDYVEQDRDGQEEDAFQILDDEGEPLSDFEDLDAKELGHSDYETL